MTIPFGIDRVLGDRPFAEVGDPILAVDDERRRLLAVAGTHVAVAGMDEFGGTAPVGVYSTDDLARRALLRARYPVHAMAFHPTRSSGTSSDVPRMVRKEKSESDSHVNVVVEGEAESLTRLADVWEGLLQARVGRVRCGSGPSQ